MGDTERRTCNRCGQSKPLLSQYPAKGGHFTNYCRACICPEDGFRRVKRIRDLAASEAEK